jgi:hypothetical protein
MPAALADLFPSPVAGFVIQNDLTAVTSGPLEHAVAAELRLLADQESRGGGGVYRFSTTSLRRAFDQGWSATGMKLWLEAHSSTGVPQPLEYLIEDVGRHHGSMRVGPAGCYVRVADRAQAAALLAHPAAAGLGLRAIAADVLIASVDEHEVLPLLQELGHTPAVENDAGELMVTASNKRATGLLTQPKAAASAADVANALLARERGQRVYSQPAAGSTKQPIGRATRPRTLARSIE